jgi:excisionase family DNA binding protein
MTSATLATRSNADHSRRLLSTPQISEQTGIPENQVRNLIDAGKIGAINISTGKRPRWRVRQCDLDAFLTPKRD